MSSFGRMLNQKSQIAVIITVVMALLIVMALVFINIAKVSDTKALTAMAADRAALSIASALGTMANQYVQQMKTVGWQPSNPNGEYCNVDWWIVAGIAAIIIGALLVIFTGGVAALALVALAGKILIGIGAVLTLGNILVLMGEGLPRVLSQMTMYSAIREGTIASGIAGVMTDTCYVMPDGGGNYHDPITGVSFHLRGTPIWSTLVKGGKVDKPIPRYIAWYYDKRFSKVSEGALQTDIKNFIDNMMLIVYYDNNDPESGNAPYWDQENWQYLKLSFPVRPNTFRPNVMANAPITCSLPNCPAWVKDKFGNKNVIMLGPCEIGDPKNWLGQVQMKDLKGFLNASENNSDFGFKTLIHRLLDECNDNTNLFAWAGDNQHDSGGSDTNFISRKSSWCLPIIGCISSSYDDTGINNMDADIKDFLSRLIELANMPINDRTTGIDTWLKQWWDFDYHPETVNPNAGPDDESWMIVKNSEDVPTRYSHDVSMRLFRVSWTIRHRWIPALDQVLFVLAKRGESPSDGGVFRRIASPLIFPQQDTTSQCWWGQGNWERKCSIAERVCDSGDDCPPPGEPGDCTHWEKKSCDMGQLAEITWDGIYGTCVNPDGKSYTQHPMCNGSGPGHRDLYGVRPGWCSDTKDSVNCVTKDECGGSGCIDPNNRTQVPIFLKDDWAFKFQGQLSWHDKNFAPGPMKNPLASADRPYNPTEIEQAQELLQQLANVIDIVILPQIRALGNKARAIIKENEATKNELTYVWNDVYPGTMQNNNVYHMVRIKLKNYPRKEDFPSISQYRKWLGLEICKKLSGLVEGDVNIEVSRFDTDQPGFWWTFRRRTVGAGAPASLASEQRAILSSGLTQATSGDAFAIKSEGQAHWSWNKSDMTITRIK